MPAAQLRCSAFFSSAAADRWALPVSHTMQPQSLTALACSQLSPFPVSLLPRADAALHLRAALPAFAPRQNSETATPAPRRCHGALDPLRAPRPKP